MIDITIVPIIPRNDNYAFILEADNGEVAVVDPGDAAPIIKVLEEKGIKPDYLLITHHHWDHTDGIDDMLAWHTCKVVGPLNEVGKIPQLDVMLDEFSIFEFGGKSVKIIDTPGHTTGHICFYFPDSGFLLAGDTLFSMGCGRLFEGRPEQMWDSLQKISALPDETMIYCGHEYTIINGKFGASIEPENEAIKKRLAEAEALQAEKKPTIPVSLQNEKDTNVFLRAGSANVFAERREKRNNF